MFEFLDLLHFLGYVLRTEKRGDFVPNNVIICFFLHSKKNFFEILTLIDILPRFLFVEIRLSNSLNKINYINKAVFSLSFTHNFPEEIIENIILDLSCLYWSQYYLCKIVKVIHKVIPGNEFFISEFYELAYLKQWYCSV